MNKNWKITLILVTLVLISVGSFVLADPPYYPEPTNNKDVPNDVVWNTSLGMYVLKSMIVDPNTGSISDPILVEGAKTTIVYEEATDMTVLVDQFKLSSSKLDKAILSYWTEKQNNSGNISVKSYYSTSDDKDFYILASLGISEVPNMLKFIEANNSEVTGVLMEAVNSITATDNGFVSAGASDRAEWIKTLKEKARKGVEMANSEEMTYTANEVEEIGVFALLYLQKMYDKGDENVANQLQKLTSSESSDRSLQPTNEDWKTWFIEHKTEMDAIVTIAQ